MPYEIFQENCQIFSSLIEHLATVRDEQISLLLKRYIEQNVVIVNEIISLSIENLKRLEHVKTANEVICTQAKLTNEISKQLTLCAQRFLNASLGQISDYNEWLKANCDLATD